jgi:hypothetical protein
MFPLLERRELESWRDTPGNYDKEHDFDGSAHQDAECCVHQRGSERREVGQVLKALDRPGGALSAGYRLWHEKHDF